jgi:murein DD-endopeptidase MepM/ murein hydrolase activator NlpD
MLRWQCQNRHQVDEPPPEIDRRQTTQMSRYWWTSALIFLAMNLSASAEEGSLRLALPTDNTALLRGEPEAFYQVVQRNFKGVVSFPWQGGQYGFVRDPRELSTGVVYTRFHEGLDIRPMHRDQRGEPLDEVRAIAPGKIVYASRQAGTSNYGRYVVIEHQWGGCPYYSLYAHLSSIAVEPGQSVQQGGTLGIMGHTGTGINRERAHVHVELNLLLNTHFEDWHATYYRTEINHHGIYNGINLAGVDLARLVVGVRQNSSLTMPAFLGKEEAFYKVLIPASPNFELGRRYPWMMEGSTDDKPPSWEVSFARSGLPLRIRPGSRPVSAAELSWLKTSPIDARYLTRENVAGRGNSARLTESGKRLMRLLTFPD